MDKLTNFSECPCCHNDEYGINEASIKKYKSNKKYKCPYCGAKFLRGDLITHIERKHEDLIPEGYDAIRVVYDSINKTDHGACMICKKPVYTWDSKHYKYANLCNDRECREEVRKIALERHMRVYNKPTLLNDPEQQEKMLARRKISGSYRFTDGGVVNYTGQYEEKALEFIDQIMGYKSSEVEVPGPVLTYKFNGEEHFYIPDIYIIPANLLIEVKDGGNNPNTRPMPEYRAKQIAKEEMVTKLGTMNYLRLTNNEFGQILAILADIKLENLDHSDDPAVKFHINEAGNSLSNEDLEMRNEGVILDKLFSIKHEFCGGGVPACCATIPKAINISTDIINQGGDIDHFVFSAPEDDNCIEVFNGEHKTIKKSDFLQENQINFTIECTGPNIGRLYEKLKNSNKISIKELAEYVSGRKCISLQEIHVGVVNGIRIIDNRKSATALHYLYNGLYNEAYLIAYKYLCMVEESIPRVNIVHCPRGYFAITKDKNSNYPQYSTEVFSNKNKITLSMMNEMVEMRKSYMKGDIE